MRFLRILALVFAGMASWSGASSKSPGLNISFHPEGAESDGPRMVVPDLTADGQKHWFRISPEVSTRHCKAFYAFPAKDGITWGVALQLNEEGRNAMQMMSLNYAGKLLRTMVNGRPVDTVRIDRSPDDGYIVIWRGLTNDDLKLMSDKLKRIDNNGRGN